MSNTNTCTCLVWPCLPGESWGTLSSLLVLAVGSCGRAELVTEAARRWSSAEVGGEGWGREGSSWRTTESSRSITLMNCEGVTAAWSAGSLGNRRFRNNSGGRTAAEPTVGRREHTHTHTT